MHMQRQMNLFFSIDQIKNELLFPIKHLAEVTWPFYFSLIIYLRYFSCIFYFFSSIEIKVVKMVVCPLIKQKNNKQGERENTTINYEWDGK